MAPQLAKRRRGILTPRTLFPSLREEMDRLSTMFDEFFGGERMVPAGIWDLPMDITETEDKIMVKADLPGIDPKELDISVSDNILTLTGEKKEEKEEEGEYSYCTERRYGSFSRSVDLPSIVDPDKVDASYHNGVLKIQMQKAQAAKRKKIPVKAT